MPPPEKRQRRFVTFRLRQEDKQLLQRLGGTDDKNAKDRHDALVALAAIVPTLSVPKVSESKRYPIRVGLPLELDQALEKMQVATGQPALVLLLAAASEYSKLQSDLAVRDNPKVQPAEPAGSQPEVKKRRGRPPKTVEGLPKTNRRGRKPKS